ncbi:uncharacterized protein LOC144450235 [Glandiceps talaboti]
MSNIFLVVCLHILLIVDGTFQQSTVDRSYNCLDATRKCITRDDQCMYSLVVPRRDGKVCPKVNDALLEIEQLQNEIADLRTKANEVNDLRRELDEIKPLVQNLANCDCGPPATQGSGTRTTTTTTDSSGITAPSSTTCLDVRGAITCSTNGYCSYSRSPFLQVCTNGICECNGEDYSICTCLPRVAGCEIQQNSPGKMALASFESDALTIVYSCTGENSDYEVHVLSNYEGNGHTGFQIHNTGNTTVNIHGSSSDTPIILVLASYEPVNWILNFDDSTVMVTQAILISYYVDESDVTDHGGQVAGVTRGVTGLYCGYGSDLGGCDTVDILKYLQTEYGTVTSFTGTYRADKWELTLLSNYVSETRWTPMTFQYDSSYIDCYGDQYVKQTPYEKGKYVGVVLCSPTRYKIFLSNSLTGEFLNIGDGGGHGQDHCEFVGGTDPATSIDNDFLNAPSVYGFARYSWGQTLEMRNIGEGTGFYYGKWIECDVSIP